MVGISLRSGIIWVNIAKSELVELKLILLVSAINCKVKFVCLAEKALKSSAELFFNYAAFKVTVIKGCLVYRTCLTYLCPTHYYISLIGCILVAWIVYTIVQWLGAGGKVTRADPFDKHQHTPVEYIYAPYSVHRGDY